MVLLLLTASASSAAADGAAPRYTIAQLFGRGRPEPEVRFAKRIEERAVITSASYRVEREMIRRYYFDPVAGPQVRALLQGDPIVRFADVDRFLQTNLDRIDHASFYPEGFVLLQLERPQSVLILPVSLVTVNKAEAAIKAYLALN